MLLKTAKTVTMVNGSGIYIGSEIDLYQYNNIT